MYVKRTLETFFLKAAAQFPVMLVNGARQVGKTTFLRRLAKRSRTYVTLDDPRALSLAKEEPALFMQRFSPPVLIDEIQYAPELLPYIKMAVDRERTAGAFWLTGSQQFQLMPLSRNCMVNGVTSLSATSMQNGGKLPTKKLMRGVSESLAGRIGMVELLGFSRSERMPGRHVSTPFLPVPKEIQRRLRSGGTLSLPQLYSMIWRGAFPAIAVSAKMDRDLFYSSYVQTYLQRDVRDLARVGDEMAFLRFLRAAAARSGQLLNVADLARDADVAHNTAKQWLSILQTSGILYLLEPYFTNRTKRLVKAPKLYFLDSGLCAYLTEWSSPETLEAGAMSGAILETWIFSEILKSWRHNGRHAPFFYYRDRDQKEIDLVIVQDGTLYPVEFKKTASPGKDAVSHFRFLEKLKMPVGPGGVVCMVPEYLPLTDSVGAIPVSAL